MNVCGVIRSSNSAQQEIIINALLSFNVQLCIHEISNQIKNKCSSPSINFYVADYIWASLVLVQIMDGNLPCSPWDCVLEYLQSSRSSPMSADVSIITGDGVRVPSHKLVLAALSPMLKQSMEEDTTTIMMPEYSAEHLEEYFNSLYSCQNINGYYDISNNLGILISPDASKMLQEENNGDFPIKSKVVRKRKKKSIVWEHFQHCSETGKCVCTHCFQIFTTNNGSTSAMLKHLLVTHQDKLSLDQLPSNYSIIVDKEQKLDTAQSNCNLSIDGLKCNECGKEFATKSSARNHWRCVHSTMKPFTCPICNKNFIRKECFNTHVSSHTNINIRKFMCSECGKTFNRRHSRDIHERVHRNDLRFPCQHCDKKFINNYQLSNHERTHTGEKPFACSECDKKFTQKHHLVTHRRSHSGVKPYHCDQCKGWFKYLSSKNNHKCMPILND